MKRLLTVLVAVGCWMVLAAQIHPQSPIVPGNTDPITLLFYSTQGNAALKSTTSCYSHMGLLTSESKDIDDIKYTTSVYLLGDQAEPKWTRVSSTTVWKYTISDLYTFFNCPKTADVTGIVVTMHDGNGSSSTLGLDEHNKPIFVPIQRTADCTYTVLMGDEGGNGWQNGALYIFDNGYQTVCELADGSKKAVSVPSYGTKQVLKYEFGNNDSEVSFSVIGKGGKELYSHNAGESFAIQTTLSSDVCATDAGDYTIKNLRYEVNPYNPNAYSFKWDKNPNIPNYKLEIIKSNGQFLTSYYAEDADNITIAFNDEASDNCRVVVYGALDADNIFGGGTWIDFPYEQKTMGQTTVRMLIPTDCSFHTDGGVFFKWKDGSINGEAEMSREGDSHWWSVTTNITAPRYQFDVYSMAGVKKQDLATSADLYTSTRVCEEMGVNKYEIENGGVTTAYYDRNPVFCDAKDHDYSIASSDVVYEDGLATFSWKPAVDQASYYRITIYQEGDVVLDYHDVSKESYSYRYTGSENITVTHWTIQPYVKLDAGYYVPVATEYKAVKSFLMENPYCPKNISAAKGEENRYVISWDAYDKATKYNISCTAQVPSYILSGDYEVGKDIRKVGNKFQIATDPVIQAGACKVTIKALDEEGYTVGTATYGFSATVEDLGKVKVSVLIPEDCCYDVSNGIYFRWESNNDAMETLLATKDKDSHWYSAEITVNATSFSLWVNDQPAESWKSGHVLSGPNNITGRNPKLYVRNNGSGWSLLPADADLKDHNYIPQSVQIVPLPTEGTLQITVGAKDFASYYIVDLFKKSTNSLYKSFTLYPTESDQDFMTRIVDPRETQEVEIGRVVVKAYDIYDEEYCKNLDKNLEFTVPLNALFPTGLEINENEDGTVTFYWDAKLGVDYYFATMYFNGSKLESQAVNTEFISPVGGKYSATFSNLVQNGEYAFSVYGYALEDGYNIGTATIYPKLTKQPAYDQAVKLRVLIASDNSMILNKGVWFCYWTHGQNMKTQGQFVKATANGRWYEASINAGAPFYFIVHNSGTWTGSYDNSDDSRLIKEDACMEMPYYNYLTDVACDAPDHDYRINKVDVDNSKAGRAILTITPNKDVAPHYYVEARKKGTSDFYQWIGSSEDGSNVVTCVVGKTIDQEYDYRVYPLDSIGNELTAYYQGSSLSIKGNPNIPYDLNTIVNGNGDQVTFSWKGNGTETAYYHIILGSTGGYDLEETIKVEGTEYTAELSVRDEYYWELEAYDKDGNLLARVEGSTFETNTPDMSPYDPNASVNGKKATLAWRAPDVTPMCHYVIYDRENYELVEEGYVTGVDGWYSATFTLNEAVRKNFYWSVQAIATDKKTELSGFVFGSYFTIQGSASTPMPSKTYSLHISSSDGGYVNYAVNGNWGEGKNVVIEATPYTAWDFLEWSDGNKNAKRVITMDKDYNLTAHFYTMNSFTVKVTAGEHGKVNNVNGTYEGGIGLDLVATPDPGYKFVAWTDGSTEASRLLQVVKDIELTAYFAAIKFYTLDVTIEPAEGGTVLFDGNKVGGNSKTYQEGTSVFLTAEPAEGYEFDHIEDGSKSTDGFIYLVTMNENKLIKVFFKKAEGIESIQNSEVRGEKVIENGQLYLKYNGTVYDAQGKVVKSKK